MSDLDEFFPREKDYDHPKLRAWLRSKEGNDVGDFFVEFRRKRRGLSFDPAMLYVTIKAKDGRELVSADSEPWDFDLNEALIDKKFRTKTSENESERFGYMLQHMFESIEVRFGDGFFNSTLIFYLRRTPFSKHPRVKNVLLKINEYEPARDGNSYEDCIGRIKSVLANCGRYLTVDLKYTRDQATAILDGAIEYYLDERFSITNRTKLGW